MSTVLYVDVSGSVGSNQRYWDTVGHLLAEHPDAAIVAWDDDIAAEPREKFIQEFVSARRGRGGTCPSLVARHLVACPQPPGCVVIVTDGEVTAAEVQQCDRVLLEGLRQPLEDVRCYIVTSHGRSGDADKSVTCPFTRGRRCSVTVNGHVELCVREEDAALLDALDGMALDDFMDAFARVEELLIARNMGRAQADLDMHDRVVRMRARVVAEAAQRATAAAAGGGTLQALVHAVREGDVRSGLVAARALRDACLDQAGKLGAGSLADVEAKVASLLALCSGGLGGKFTKEAVRGARLARAPARAAPTGALPQDASSSEGAAVTCPVSLDDDVAGAVLVHAGEPVLAAFPHAADAVAASPLHLLAMPDVMAALRDRLGHVLGVAAAQAVTENPLNRRPVAGFLPIGQHASHVQHGNAVLARLFAGGNRLDGSPEMYWLVVRAALRQLPYLADSAAAVDAHTRFRLQSTTSRAALTGLTNYTLTRVPTDIALWFVLHSGHLGGPPDADALRLHSGAAEELLAVVRDVLRYAVAEDLEAHVLRVRALTALGRACKAFGHLRSHVQLHSRVRALVQAALPVHAAALATPRLAELEPWEPWVPIDGAASEAQVAAVLAELPREAAALPVRDIVGLAALLADPNAAVSSAPLKPSWEPPPLPVAKHLWQYKPEPPGSKHPVVPVSLATFRPHCTAPHPHTKALVPWREASEAQHGFPARLQLSGHALCIRFFCKYLAWPANAAEFLLFCWNRVKHKAETLPCCMAATTEAVLQSFRPVAQHAADTGMTPDAVFRRLQDSASVARRMAMEAAAA